MTDNENEHIRYDDIYCGIVADDKDPLLAGRLKITVPAISEEFTTDWALPCMDSVGPGSGWFDPLPVNATVWVKFQEGDPEHARYIGGSWSVPDGVSEVPIEFQREIPTNRGYKSPGGHLLEFDDGIADDNKVTQGVRIKTILGHVLKFEDDPDSQGINMTTVGGHEIFFKDKAGEQGVFIDSITGFKIHIDDENQKILLETPGGHKFDLDDASSNATMNVTADYLHTAVNDTFTASGNMKFGSSGAAENLVLGIAFQTLYNAHIHIGNLGIPGGLPIVPMGAMQLASRQFTEIG